MVIFNVYRFANISFVFAFLLFLYLFFFLSLVFVLYVCLIASLFPSSIPLILVIIFIYCSQCFFFLVFCFLFS